MASLSDYTRTGRQQLGSGSDLFEMRRSDGSLYTAIQFHPEYRGHNAINSALIVVLGFLESPMVSGLGDLVAYDLAASTFIYNTGRAWSIAEIVRTMADMGSPGSVRAGVELMRSAGNILVEGAESGEAAGIYSHGGITPWRLMVNPEGRVEIIGFALPQVEILAFKEHPDRVPREDAFRYCPPERMEARKENFSSDLFGLALVAFELMTGRPVYDGLVNDIRSKAARGETSRRLHQFREHLPATTLQLLSAALKPEIRDRHRSGQEFLDAAEDALREPALEGPGLRELMSQIGRFQPRARQTLVDANKTAALSQSDRLKVLEAEGMAESAPAARRTVSIPQRAPVEASPPPVAPERPVAAPAAFTPTASPLEALRASRAGPPRRAPSADFMAANRPPESLAPAASTAAAPAAPPSPAPPAAPPSATASAADAGRWAPPQRVRANPRVSASVESEPPPNPPPLASAPSSAPPSPGTTAEAPRADSRGDEPASRPMMGAVRPSPRRPASEQPPTEAPRPAPVSGPPAALTGPSPLTSSADRLAESVARLSAASGPSRAAPSAAELIDRVLAGGPSSRRLHDEMERMMAGQPGPSAHTVPPPPDLPGPAPSLSLPPLAPAPSTPMAGVSGVAGLPPGAVRTAPPPPVFVPPPSQAPAAPPPALPVVPLAAPPAPRAPPPLPEARSLPPTPAPMAPSGSPVVPLSPAPPASNPAVAAPEPPSPPVSASAPSAPAPVVPPPVSPPASPPGPAVTAVASPAQAVEPTKAELSSFPPVVAPPESVRRSGDHASAAGTSPGGVRPPDPLRSLARGELLALQCARAPGVAPQRHRMPAQTPLAEVAGMLVGRFVPTRVTPDGRWNGWYRLGNLTTILSPDLRVEQLAPDETWYLHPVEGQLRVFDVEIVADTSVKLRLPVHTALPVGSVIDGLAALADLPPGDWALRLDGVPLGTWHILEDRELFATSKLVLRRP